MLKSLLSRSAIFAAALLIAASSAVQPRPEIALSYPIDEYAYVVPQSTVRPHYSLRILPRPAHKTVNGHKQEYG